MKQSLAVLGFISALNIAAVAAPAPCHSGVFVVEESGQIAAVDWVNYGSGSIRTRTILTQSRVVDATIDLRPDQTASHSAVILSVAGEKPDAPKTRDLGEGAIYWSDFIPSSVEQAVRRAAVLDQPDVKVMTTSLYRDTHESVDVARVDANDWVVDVHGKRYRVLTDQSGCMVSASLPEFGVVIERRASFDPAKYPLWPAYAAAPGANYVAKEVSIAAPQGHTLAGTLTLPRGRRPLGAVVLITGLGPSNRNGGVAPWMPLRDLSDALTRGGIAVLRVDDRGVGASTGDHGPSTTYDEADDIRTTVAWLRSQKEIDPKRIALVGYSEGGLIAPMVAASDPKIAAIVILAGPGTPGDQLAREQVAAEVTHDPSIAPAARESEIARQLAEPMTARERVFLTIDPIAFARQVRCPALILDGGSDITVPARSAERLADAMRAAGNTDVTVRFVPGVSHSLLPDIDGSMQRVLFLPAFLTSPQLLEVLTQWTAFRLAKRT